MHLIYTFLFFIIGLVLFASVFLVHKNFFPFKLGIIRVEKQWCQDLTGCDLV